MVKKNGQEVKGSVFVTRDYSVFKKIRGNRNVDPNHVKRLVKAISEQDLDIPIIVDREMFVLDGQHRLEARKQLNLPVKYYIGRFSEDLDTARANTNSVKWSTINYIDFYAQRNKKDYQLLKFLIKQYGFNPDVAVIVGVKRTNRASDIFEDLKLGSYKMTALSWANEVGESYQKLIKLLGKQAKSRAFLNAFLIFFKHPEFEFKRFIHALKINGSKILGATDRMSYIRVFESVYNSYLSGRKFKKIKLVRWVEDRAYVEVTERLKAARQAGRNQWSNKNKKED